MSIQVEGKKGNGALIASTAFGCVAGAAVGIKKSGVLKNTLLADCFTKQACTQFANTWKEVGKKDAICKGFNKMKEAAKDIWKKAGDKVKNLKSLKLETIINKIKDIAKSPAAKWAGGIAAAGLVIGIISKAIIKNKNA